MCGTEQKLKLGKGVGWLLEWLFWPFDLWNYEAYLMTRVTFYWITSHM